MGLQYAVGMCPKPIIDRAVENEQRPSGVDVSENDGAVDVTIYMCQNGDECHSGLMVSIGMCPIGEVCGCDYEVFDFYWRDDGDCNININWRNPDKCVLREVRLQALSWWDENIYQLKFQQLREGTDPNMPIYPDGDPRNNTVGCRDCGIGGRVETHEAGVNVIFESQYLTPGQIYRVVGYFDDLSCGGRNSIVVLGHVLYQTTAYTSGRIIAIVDDDPPIYTVQHYVRSGGGVGLRETGVYSTDMYPWEIDDYVMLGKLETVFPQNYYGSHITSINVDQTGTDSTNAEEIGDTKLFIIPYNKIE